MPSHICPLCNGLNTQEMKCKQCNAPLVNLGRISDLYDDYSAYVEYNLNEQERTTCLHRFNCTNCETTEEIETQMIYV